MAWHGGMEALEEPVGPCWRTSSYSSNGGGECVEWLPLPSVYLVWFPAGSYPKDVVTVPSRSALLRP